MSKKDSSSETEENREIVVVDTEDAVEFDDGSSAKESSESDLEIEADSEFEINPQSENASTADSSSESEGTASTESSPESEVAATTESSPESEVAATTESTTESSPERETKPAVGAEPRPRRSWFGLFNFLLILALAGAAGYYWWQQQQVEQGYRDTIVELRQQIETRASNSRLDASLTPLKADIGGLDRKINELGIGQQSLRESSEKLYELYGRDKNDWQLAEVEYLMRVAQHKLILQDDFEGAAITLQAASDKIALTGDPGLLPVRVMISEEIADLKTRKRADLVGMTLILAQLARQVRVLEPGFEVRVKEVDSAPQPVQETQNWLDKIDSFVDSLVTIRYEDDAEPSQVEANVANVSETLEDNLKLARWAVLDRDAFQYAQLIEQSLRLFREFYDRDNAANNDFMQQLQNLQKMQLSPEKPDINGSLRELQRILSQRENAPEQAEPQASEAGND